MFSLIYRRLSFNFNFANTLGVGIYGRVSLLLLLSFIPFRRILGKNTKINKTVRLRKFGKEFDFFVADFLDFAILSAIFVEDEYDIQMTVDPEIIVDLGSNVGGSLIYFALKYPDVKIYGYEPDPATYITLQRNVKAFGNIQVEQAAITNYDGTIDFFSDPDSSMSSSLQQRKGVQNQVTVKAKTLDSLLNEHSIEKVDLLKFDVEGAEVDVFKDFHQNDKINNLIGELHIDLIDISKEEFMKMLPPFEIKEELLYLPSDPSAERYIICGGFNITS